MDFVDLIREEHANCPAYIYRGQADPNWKVESTLDRLERRFPRKKNYSGRIPEEFECPPASRDEHLLAFQEVARGRRGLNAPTLSDDEWWSLAQHHGLATPMLDWTYSAFVALFFAFEESDDVDHVDNAPVPEHRVVYALSTSTIGEGDKKPDSPGPTPFSPKGETNYRLVNQGGILLKMPPGVDLETYVRGQFSEESSSKDNRHARAILQKILIPNLDRLDCLKFLSKMNINRMSLFPDLDGAAQFINSNWELGFDSPVGRFRKVDSWYTRKGLDFGHKIR